MVVRTGRVSSPANSSRAVALSRGDVTAAAMALIDTEGVARCTMRRLAATLDITGSALYWHFSNRDDLLSAVAVAMLAEVDTSVPEAEQWPDHHPVTLTAPGPHPCQVPERRSAPQRHELT